MFERLKKNVSILIKLIEFLINDYKQHRDEEKKLNIRKKEIKRESRKIAKEERKILFDIFWHSLFRFK